MKSAITLFSAGITGSRPAWGAWIEIPDIVFGAGETSGRAPHGARGLKSCQECWKKLWLAVAPRMGRVD